MNKLLRLSGTPLSQGPKVGGGGGVSLPKGATVSSTHLRGLILQLEQILLEWEKYHLFSGKLIDVVHTQVMPKSNRISYLFGSKGSDDKIRGIRYKSPLLPKQQTQHIITYYLSEDILNKTILNLQKAVKILEKAFGGTITANDMSAIRNESLPDLSPTSFKKLIKDCFYIEKIAFPKVDNLNWSHPQVVNFYQTEERVSSILEKSGINIRNLEQLDDLTFVVKPKELQLLQEKLPFLISMSCSDFSKLELRQIEEELREEYFNVPLPEPRDEPVVGVLDTLFDDRVYFSAWVEYVNLLDPEVVAAGSSPEDFQHGTKVSYLIVDGPSLNPGLEDGCGRFRVKHFAVAKSGPVSGFMVLKNIIKAVEENPEIKVWNLSLGSNLEISQNTISYIAAELDKLQATRPDLIFVIGATNKPVGISSEYFIGSPADSINSVVVNACTRKGGRTSYSRHGPVLSFFTKPDVCCFGGEGADQIITAAPYGKAGAIGTSFAAPWIARKFAYLMYKIGLSREEAKALIIDSTLVWEEHSGFDNYHGFGCVPLKIEDILSVKDSEIKFFISGTLNEKQLFTYQIPVPIIKAKFPFVSRAVLTYSPKCDRTMGVDYTETELDLKFGRVNPSGVKGTTTSPSIKPINDDRQGDPGKHNLPEGQVRDKFRKWDNVKVISEILTPKKRSLDTLGGLYGLKIVRTERRGGILEPLAFSVLVTLKNLNGVNVISTFIKNCQACGWLVQQIDVKSSLKLYTEAEEEISFES